MNNVREAVVHFAVWRQMPYKMASPISLPRQGRGWGDRQTCDTAFETTGQLSLN